MWQVRGMQVLTDADLDQIVTPPRARQWMREAVLAAGRGDFAAPARAAVRLPRGSLSFTCGELSGRWYGHRSYLAPGSGSEQQVVVLHGADGQVDAVAIGTQLGLRRSGAIGGVAAEALAPPTVAKIALLGSGHQAWYQLWGLPERLRRAEIAVYSPQPSHREAFAARVREELGLSASAAASTTRALAGAQVIIVATASDRPVFDARDIEPGAYLATVGTKQVRRCEFDLVLAEQSALLVTDSLTQVANYDPAHILFDTPQFARLLSLSQIVSGDYDKRARGRVFFSAGLGGSEVYLLAKVVESLMFNRKGECLG